MASAIEVFSTPVRDPKTGYFLPGNQIGRGNPFARAQQGLKSALWHAVTREDIEVIARALIDQARGGDLAAICILLDRLLGRPTQAIEMSDSAREGTSAMLARLLADVRAAQTRVVDTPTQEPRDVTPVAEQEGDA